MRRDRWTFGLLLLAYLAITLRFVATVLDRDKLHDALDRAVIVVDAEDLERSRRDPRVRAFHESAEELLVELDAEGAEYP